MPDETVKTETDALHAMGDAHRDEHEMERHEGQPALLDASGEPVHQQSPHDADDVTQAAVESDEDAGEAHEPVVVEPVPTMPLRQSAQQLYDAGSGTGFPSGLPDTVPTSGGGEGHNAPPVPVVTVQRDHEGLLAHLKAWVRRELALHGGGMGHEERVEKNP